MRRRHCIWPSPRTLEHMASCGQRVGHHHHPRRHRPHRRAPSCLANTSSTHIARALPQLQRPKRTCSQIAARRRSFSHTFRLRRHGPRAPLSWHSTPSPCCTPRCTPRVGDTVLLHYFHLSVRRASTSAQLPQAASMRATCTVRAAAGRARDAGAARIVVLHWARFAPCRSGPWSRWAQDPHAPPCRQDQPDSRRAKPWQVFLSSDSFTVSHSQCTIPLLATAIHRRGSRNAESPNRRRSQGRCQGTASLHPVLASEGSVLVISQRKGSVLSIKGRKLCARTAMIEQPLVSSPLRLRLVFQTGTVLPAFLHQTGNG